MVDFKLKRGNDALLLSGEAPSAEVIPLVCLEQEIHLNPYLRVEWKEQEGDNQEWQGCRLSELFAKLFMTPR